MVSLVLVLLTEAVTVSNASAVASQPPAPPTLLSPASEAVLSVTDPQFFTLTTVDPDGDTYAGLVTVVNRSTGVSETFPSSPAASGAVSSAAAIPPLASGDYLWSATATDSTGAASAASATGSFRVGSNHPPAAPVLLNPDDGAVLSRNEPQRFVVNATDPEADPVRATVTIRDAAGGFVESFTTTVAASGMNASGVAAPSLSEGRYTWSAHASDPFGAVGPESGGHAILITGPLDIGAGLFTGTIDYGRSGIPPGTCGPTTMTVSALSGAAVVNLAIAGYVGPIEFSGSGGSACEDPVLGSGTLTLTASGVGPTSSTIGCGPLGGSYTRVVTTVAMTVSGTCTINGFNTARVSFTLAGEAVPTDVGAGVIVPLKSSMLIGAFVVTPS